MRRITTWFLLGALTCGGIEAVSAQELRYLKTPDQRLLYFYPTESYLAPHAARSFENSLLGQRAIFDYQPYDRTTILLKDFTDYGNAGAIPVPRNMVLVDIGPRALTFETASTPERQYTWMNHELVHLVMTDMANKKDRRYRSLFHGKVAAISDHPETILYQFLTNPRLASPRWYHEGMAVFTQTWMAGGAGRAQGAYDEMVFRSMVRDGAHFYDPLGLVAEGTRVDFQVGVNAYLYGTRFISYLAYTYSPGKLVDWVARTDGSRRLYSAQFQQVFGLTIDEAWQDWIDWEHEFQQANLTSIRQFPTTPYDDLSERALGSVSKAHIDTEKRVLYAGIRYPGIVAHIGAISLDDGTVRRIRDIKGPKLYKVTSLAFDPATRTLFYTADNNAYRDLMSLDPDTGETDLLLRDARIGELAFNRADRSLWGVRHLNGISTLVRVPFPYDEWQQVHTFEYGVNFYDLDLSPDGQLLSASHGDIRGNQSLRVMRTANLLAGDLAPMTMFEFGTSVPESFRFSPDGRYLFGSSYYTGVSNIFRYELATGEMEAVSNAETGFFRPVPQDDSPLIVFRYTGQGFVPARIDPAPLEDVSAITFLGTKIIERHPGLREWQAGSPADIPLDELTRSEGEYVPREHISLESLYPVMEGYKDSVGVGLRANFSDEIGFDRLGITATATPTRSSNELMHFYVKYKHQRIDQFLPGAWTTELKYNYADFYDMFGPTKVARKGYSGEVTYERPLIFDDPRRMDLEIRVGYWGNLDEVPYAQDIEATFDDLANASVRLEDSFVRRSLGAVDDEKGYKWSVVAGSNYADSTVTPYVFGGFDYGWALPLRHSSIWLRSALGRAFGDRDDEFANFYFGGFRNNWVDHQEVKRYREPFAFPAFDIDDFKGRSFARSILEWNLPPVRFRRVGSSANYLSWARPAIFASGLITDPEEDEDENYYNIGAQVDFQFTILSSKSMTLSFGYAWGFTDGSQSHRDFMASLKIL